MSKTGINPTEYFCCANCKVGNGKGCGKMIGNNIYDYHCAEIDLIDNPVKIDKLKKDDPIQRVKDIGYIKLDNYIDNVRRFYTYNPFFYDKSNMFWIWNKIKKKYDMADDTQIMNLLDLILGLEGQTVTRTIKNNYLEAFKRVGRQNIPRNAPKKWIQFKGKVFSIESGKIYEATPDYFFTNPIPHELGKSTDTPTMDRLFKEWVGKENVDLLYEMISYCCIRDYPIHLVFCLIGCGRNGKSKFLGLLNKFLGGENICSTELDTLLNSRFESFKLYKKLLCTMGETNFGVLNKTSLLKRLCGQDLIGFEFKNKVPFDDYNNAKILIASNSLPTSEDTSEGFYRRWLIIDFPNIFPEGKDILNIIPEEEYKNLAMKVVDLLPKLLKRGCFINQDNIEQRKKKYIMSSNPLPMFIEENFYINYNDSIRYSEMYQMYINYLQKKKRRIVSKKEFGNALSLEGFEARRTTKKIDDSFVTDRWVEGLTTKIETNIRNTYKL